MRAFFLILACINLALCAMCIKKGVTLGALFGAFGVAWSLATLLGWLA